MKRPSKVKILEILVSVLLVLAAGGWYGLLRFGGTMCGNQVVSETVSPDNRLKAVVFRRDCGATTGYSTQVTVTQHNTSLQDAPGNVFSADTDHGAAPESPAGGPLVRLQWTSNQSLSIHHHPAARVFRSERRFGGVNVEYRLDAR